MLFKSEIVTAASGSIGGVVYAHHSAGLVRRSKPARANGRSPLQLETRNRLATINALWRNTLTQANRDAWDEYANQTPLLGVFGRKHLISGYQHFLKANSIRMAAGKGALLPGPAAPSHEYIQTDDFNASIPGPFIGIGFDPTAHWASTLGTILRVQCTAASPPSRSDYSRRWRTLAFREGHPTIPPAPIIETYTPFDEPIAGLSSGTRLGFRFLVLWHDGRLTNQIEEWHAKP